MSGAQGSGTPGTPRAFGALRPFGVPDAPPVVVSELRYRYPRGAADVLHDVSFIIERGTIFGLLGPSGAGKSTTIKALLGLLADYHGSVRLFGHEMRRPARELYRAIGVCFETPRFYPQLSARENLHFFADLIGAEHAQADALLERFDLGAHADARAAGFSKGMRMRLNVARALLGNPAVLVLDEPTAGLDPRNAALVKSAIVEARDRGAAVVLTTHDMHVADQLSDTVAFIVDGRIAESAPPRDFKLRFGTRALRVEYRTPSGLQARFFPLDTLGGDTAFAALLADSQRIETMHTEETSLEQVFIRITGRSLSGEAPDVPPGMTPDTQAGAAPGGAHA